MAHRYGRPLDYSLDGTYDKPFPSPTYAYLLGFGGVTSTNYYFLPTGWTTPIELEYKPYHYDSDVRYKQPYTSYVRVFQSPYAGAATVNLIDQNLPMRSLLVERDTLDIRAAVYFKVERDLKYNTTADVIGIEADGGYPYQRVILGYQGGHGFYNNHQRRCSWSDSIGGVGAGYDGSTCGSFPNDLKWGTGQFLNATYANRSGTWSHWISW